MKPLKLRFTTFLKLCGSSPASRISQLQKFNQPGGYDYYKLLRKSVHGNAKGDLSHEEAEKRLSKIGVEHERKNNLGGYKAYKKWWDRLGAESETPPKGKFQTESKLLTISIEPEICFVEDGRKKIVHLWNTANPTLKKSTAGLGVHFLSTRFKNLPKGSETLIFNLRLGKIFDSTSITNSSEIMLQNELVSIENLWSQIGSE